MLASFRDRRRGGVPLLVVAMIATMAGTLPATASAKPPPAREFSFQGEQAAPDSMDARSGRVSPSARQRKLAAGTQVRWNVFGTPLSIFDRNGWLATGLSRNDGVAARTWLKRDRALFRLSRAEVDGLDVIMKARVRALPTPRDGVRPVWETIVFDNATGGDPLAFLSWVDAQTGKVWRRESLVAHADDDPKWKVFEATPRPDYASSDIRELWCWSKPSAGCDRLLQNDASPNAWDVDPATGESTHTTFGNNARSVENLNDDDPFSVGTNPATARADRNYSYPWTNQWFEQRCNPDVHTSPRRNDLDAAIANLFAMHNRMHDWSYHLGFTEQTFNLQQSNFGLGGAEAD